MILSVEGIEFYYKSKKVLDNVKFNVSKGELVSILGVNGAGKSTLLKCIAKILKPKKGTILLENLNLNNLDRKSLAKLLGYVPQKSDGTYLTVFDTILLGRKPFITWEPSKEDLKKTYEIIKLLNLEDYTLRYTNELSGGELQKVVIARALVQEPKVLLLDEPTNNLDLKNQIEILKLIRKITKEKNIVTIMVMHDINLALRYSDTLIFMKDGKIVDVRKKDSVTPDIIREVYEIDVTIQKINNIPIVIPLDT
ncbi:ABC transporter related protein [Methanocaldococcus infernus ME]|uniref:ABC transporter related protein n=1 Tax=Methanocaldococcus infernus (strain DSM 11812 / JCM 15783 / ME) TaxID=573063 RepID=D5VU20_METIM|nr:ABC transporter ATP-binding protein [Methanocaldococcus infernus]ADG14073.1 ABC transporter related protein [Methanocaldococcus infernus ME]